MGCHGKQIVIKAHINHPSLKPETLSLYKLDGKCRIDPLPAVFSSDVAELGVTRAAVWFMARGDGPVPSYPLALPFSRFSSLVRCVSFSGRPLVACFHMSLMALIGLCVACSDQCPGYPLPGATRPGKRRHSLQVRSFFAFVRRSWSLQRLHCTGVLLCNLPIYFSERLVRHQSDCFVSIPAFIYAALKVANVCVRVCVWY